MSEELGHEARHDRHGHAHHGHANDRGFGAMLRYLRWAPQMWSSDLNQAVHELVAPRAGEVVVDIGAGMGPGTTLAAKAGATVIAVEPTPYMRTVLATRLRGLRSRDRARVTVVAAGAESLPASDGWIDAIWAVNTMHHWLDPEQAALEIGRVLRPDGRLVLVDEDFGDPTHPDHERFGDHHHDEAEHGDDGEHHGFTLVDADQMGELLLAAGVADVIAEKRTIAGVPVIAVTARV